MPLYTRDEVAVHNTADDCWLIISGRVYDVTSWIADHPGGSRVVSAQAGLDVSQLFASFHDASVLETVAAPFLIGSITGKEEEEHRQGQDGEKEAGQSADRQREQVVAGGVYAGAETAHSKEAATISGLQLSHRSAGGGQSRIDVTISAEELAALKNISELETYGAEDEESKIANQAGWARFALRPRVAVGRNITRVSLRTTVLGRELALPVMLGAAGGHGLVHHRAEIATARAAAAAGTVGGIAQRAHFPLSRIYREAQEAARAAGRAESSPTLVWQLYVPRLRGADEMDREYCEAAIKYASQCGYHALCVTVDTPVPGNREQTYGDPAWAQGMREQCGGFPSIHSLDEVEGLGANLPGGHCGALTWADIQWMAELTPMQLIVKGIMTAEDAACAASCPGVAAIVVSNHGGRQLDGCLGSAEALEECVDAVASSGLEVLVDGGVRRGRDVLRALALGASAVFIGRPVFWGLALGGEAGLGRVLEMFHDELTTCMQLCGCRTVADIQRAHVHDRGGGMGAAAEMARMAAALAAKERLIEDLQATMQQIQAAAVQARL